MTIKDSKYDNTNSDEPEINLSTPEPAEPPSTTPFSQALDGPAPPANNTSSYAASSSSSPTPVATATYVGTGDEVNKPSYTSTTPVQSTTNMTTTTTTAAAAATNTSKVPPGAPPGGQWVMAKYAGNQTWTIIGVTGCCLCFFAAIILGPCALWGLLCPCDETRAYMAPNGDLFDPSGKKIGHRDKNKWTKI